MTAKGTTTPPAPSYRDQLASIEVDIEDDEIEYEVDVSGLGEGDAASAER